MPGNKNKITDQEAIEILNKNSQRDLTNTDVLLSSRSSIADLLTQLSFENITPEIITHCQQAKDSLSHLLAVIDPFYHKNESGLYPILSLQDQNSLLTAYQQSMDLIATLQENLKKEFKAQAEPLCHSFTQLLGYMTSDFKILSNLIINENTNLPDAIYDARSLTMEAPKNTLLHSVGNVLSHRIPLSYVDSYGNTHNGFFTENYAYNARQRFNQLALDYAKKYPAFAKYFETFTLLKDASFYIEDIKKASPSRLALSPMDLAENPVAYGLKANAFSSYKNNANFEEACEAFRSACGSEHLSDLLRLQYLNGISDGSNAPARNTALSRMAALMGVSHLVATSREMTLIKDGKPYKGHFMDAAQGTDITSVRSDDPMALYDMSVYDNSPGLKQLADLQVLDYICGNTDRHSLNYTYQFDLTDKKNPKFSGIVGYDNDLSFGRVLLESDRKPGVNGVSLDNIQTISKSMADRIEGLEIETVKLILLDIGLDTLQVDACIARLLQIQSRIRDGKALKWKSSTELKPEKIHVIEDADYLKFKVSDLATYQNGHRANRFADLLNVPKYIREQAPLKSKEDRHFNRLKRFEPRDITQEKNSLFTKATKVDVLYDPSTYIGFRQDFQTLYNQLAATKTTLHGSKEQFDTMLSSLEKMIAICADHFTDSLVFQNGLNDLLFATQAYITYKQDHMNRFHTAQTRMALANELTELTKATKRSFYSLIDQQAEQDKVAINRDFARQLEQKRKSKNEPPNTPLLPLRQQALELKEDIASLFSNMQKIKQEEEKQLKDFIRGNSQKIDVIYKKKVNQKKLTPEEQSQLKAFEKLAQNHYKRMLLLKKDSANIAVQTDLLRYASSVQKLAQELDRTFPNAVQGADRDFARMLHAFATMRHPNAHDTSNFIELLDGVFEDNHIDKTQVAPDSNIGKIVALIDLHHECFANDALTQVATHLKKVRDMNTSDPNDLWNFIAGSYADVLKDLKKEIKTAAKEGAKELEQEGPNLDALLPKQ